MTSDLIERLRAGQDGDHKRGCAGRQYTCSCGYDDRLRAAAQEAADRIASLEAVLADATTLLYDVNENVPGDDVVIAHAEKLLGRSLLVTDRDRSFAQREIDRQQLIERNSK